MGEIYDFQTNYIAKIEESSKLIEKGYIDQVICMLEDFLAVVKDPKIKQEVNKQLMTAYLLKGELDTCEALILEIKNQKSLDLTIAAHDILVAMFQGQEASAKQKQEEYQQLLGLTALSSKNLVELIYQLKTYYESVWYEMIEKKIQVLEREGDLETQLLVISDLRTVDSWKLQLFQEKFEQLLNQCEINIVKTMLFELLAQKDIECSVNFTQEQNHQTLITTTVNFEAFYATLEEALALLTEMTLDEVTREVLKQHVIFFYQFSFPFIEEMNPQVVINELAQVLFRMNLTETEDEEAVEKTEKIAGIRYKMSQYILSLSSLM